ncbi:MAG: TSUP family transporter [Micromonosporaceae bacterium]|nr:TSUP family transporter [Micromonosporaceae bacterium]
MIDWLATPEVAFLVAAATVAGIVGTAGGMTSLVSFPALLVLGVPPLEANIASLMAAVICWPASAAVSQPELRAVRDQLPRGLLAAAAGAALGTSLLLVTPAATFDVVVPFLVAAGSVILLVSPRLTQHSAGGSTARGGAAAVWVALVSIYGGYFGAGAGVMLLAASLILITPDMPRANACKNMFLGAGALTSALLLAFAAVVPWALVAVLASGLLAGSLIGPILARRLPAPAIRWTVAALGFVLASTLAASAF